MLYDNKALYKIYSPVELPGLKSAIERALNKREKLGFRAPPQVKVRVKFSDSMQFSIFLSEMHFNSILYFENINNEYVELENIVKTGVNDYKIDDLEFFHALSPEVVLKNSEERRTTLDDLLKKPKKTILEVRDFVTDFENHRPLLNDFITQIRAYEFPELPQIHEEIDHLYWMSQNQEYVDKEKIMWGLLLSPSADKMDLREASGEMLEIYANNVPEIEAKGLFVSYYLCGEQDEGNLRGRVKSKALENCFLWASQVTLYNLLSRGRDLKDLEQITCNLRFGELNTPFERECSRVLGSMYEKFLTLTDKLSINEI